MSRDQSPLLPETFAVAFRGRRCTGTPPGPVPAAYVSSTPLSARTPTDDRVASGLAGVPGTTRTVRDAAVALFAVGSAAPRNQAALDRLAARLAQDTLDWATAAAPGDVSYAGIAAPAPSALVDRVEWDYTPGRVATRLVSPPYRGHEPEEYQHWDDAAEGCRNPRTTTYTPGVAVDVPGAGLGASAWGLLGLEGGRLVLAEPAIATLTCGCSQATCSLCVTVLSCGTPFSDSEPCVGFPYKSATVTLSQGGEVVQSALTDAHGVACFSVTSGTYTVGADACTAPKDVTVDCPGQVDVCLTRNPLVTLRFTHCGGLTDFSTLDNAGWQLVDAAGKYAGGGSVGPDGSASFCTTKPPQAFTVKWLGLYTPCFPDQVVGTLTTTDTCDDVATFALTSAIISNQWHVWGCNLGTPLAGADITFVLSDGNVYSGTSDARGQLTLALPATCTGTVTASKPRFVASTIAYPGETSCVPGPMVVPTTAGGSLLPADGYHCMQTLLAQFPSTYCCNDPYPDTMHVSDAGGMHSLTYLPDGLNPGLPGLNGPAWYAACTTPDDYACRVGVDCSSTNYYSVHTAPVNYAWYLGCNSLPNSTAPFLLILFLPACIGPHDAPALSTFAQPPGWNVPFPFLVDADGHPTGPANATVYFISDGATPCIPMMAGFRPFSPNDPVLRIIDVGTPVVSE